MTTLTLGQRLRGGWGGLLIGLLALVLNIAVFCAVFRLINGDISRPAPVKVRPVIYQLPQPVRPHPVPVQTETAKPRPKPEIKKAAQPVTRPTPRPQISPPRLDVAVKTSPLPGPKLGPPPRPPATAAPARPAPAQAAARPQIAALPGPAKITPPGLVSRIPPLYPYAARRRGLEGWVEIRLAVDESGRVKQVEVIKSEPKKVFEAAVIKAARQWRFNPALKQGQPVAAAYRTVVRFELK